MMQSSTKELWFKKTEVPVIKNVIGNIQFKSLDQNHVVPNMGPITGGYRFLTCLAIDNFRE
jgi:hypothetical protein